MIKNTTIPEKITPATETSGLSVLGGPTHYRFDQPDASILEAFPNLYPQRNYCIRFEYPEFTSLCPKTGQPDFGTIILEYAPQNLCVESKSFKLYMAAFRNEGSFMESITNRITDDLIAILSPKRITVHGLFNVRGGASISVKTEHFAAYLSAEEKTELLRLW